MWDVSPNIGEESLEKNHWRIIISNPECNKEIKKYIFEAAPFVMLAEHIRVSRRDIRSLCSLLTWQYHNHPATADVILFLCILTVVLFRMRLVLSMSWIESCHWRRDPQSTRLVHLLTASIVFLSLSLIDRITCCHFNNEDNSWRCSMEFIDRCTMTLRRSISCVRK